jgi:putative transposase
MPPKPRDRGPGLFHIYTHCVWAAPALFRTDSDRVIFLDELARVVRVFGWTCVGFCLMNSHYHLIIDIPDANLPDGMQSLNFRYAINFNRRYRLRGRTLFAPYGSRRIPTEPDLLSTYRYVMRNPVEARLCSSPAEWPWSSYAGTVGLTVPHSFVDATLVLNGFDGPPELRVARLRRFVEAS